MLDSPLSNTFSMMVQRAPRPFHHFAQSILILALTTASVYLSLRTTYVRYLKSSNLEWLTTVEDVYRLFLTSFLYKVLAVSPTLHKHIQISGITLLDSNFTVPHCQNCSITQSVHLPLVRKLF